MRLRASLRAALLRTLLTGVLFCGASSSLFAQLTVETLLGSSVDQIDDRYRNVSDALVLFQRGNGPAALKLLQEVKVAQPHLPPGEVLFAHLCFASNQGKPGLDALQVAAVRFQDDPEVWNMLADLLLREGRLAEADLLFRKAVTVANNYNANPKRQKQLLFSALAGAASANERRGLWAEAEPFLSRWLELNPENPEVPSRLAIALLNTKRFDEATQILDKLREIRPEQLPSEIVLGTAYDQLGNTEQAKASLLSGLEKHGDNFGVQMAVAAWAIKHSDDELAHQCAAAAAKLEPASPLPKLVNAQVAYQQGDFANAETLFQEVYQSKPGNFDAVNGLALSILAQADKTKYPLAQEYAELLVRNNSDLRTLPGRQAATLLAWALHRNGNSQDAERLITTILGSGPVNAATAYFAAEIYAHRGQKETALNALDKVLSSTTGFPYYVQAEALKKKLSTP